MSRRSRVKDRTENDWTVPFSWNFPRCCCCCCCCRQSAAVFGGPLGENNVLSQMTLLQDSRSTSGVGRKGSEGLMTWALLTLAPFACSPHRLIVWHPKYSATFHQTTDRQPHLNSRNSTRESHHNPVLQTQIFETFMLSLHPRTGLATLTGRQNLAYLFLPCKHGKTRQTWHSANSQKKKPTSHNCF